MPGEKEGGRAAALADIHFVLRALWCAVGLLEQGLGRAGERAVILTMRGAIRRAESALRRLPSPTDL
jgi:hypothetical protein